MHYFRIYHAMKDSIYSENNRRNVIIKETDWMLKRKEIENTHLKKNNTPPYFKMLSFIFSTTLIHAVCASVLAAEESAIELIRNTFIEPFAVTVPQPSVKVTV